MNRKLILYYLAMLLILISWNNPESLPPLILRLAFISALMIPLVYYRLKSSPFILLSFVVISAASYAVSYMPVDGLYLLIASLILIGCKGYKADGLSIPNGFILLLILSFVIDLFFSDSLTISYNWLTIFFVSRYLVPKNNEKYIQFVAFSFAVISLVLSIQFVAVGDLFVRDVHTAMGDLDRKGWTDPNYFGSVIGIGILTSLIELLYYKNHLKLKVFYMLTIVLSSYTIATTASRGATVALVFSAVILLLFSKIKVKYKVSVFVLVFILLVVMYNFGMLDLLLLRFISDEGDLGGRGYIWETRLSHFVTDLNAFQWLFGIGTEKALTLGTERVLGFHNDYLSALVSYGFIGLLCLFNILLSPLKKSSRRNKPIVLSLISYIALCMGSIEPFTGGQWSCLYFYIFILMLSQINYKYNGNKI